MENVRYQLEEHFVTDGAQARAAAFSALMAAYIRAAAKAAPDGCGPRRGSA